MYKIFIAFIVSIFFGLIGMTQSIPTEKFVLLIHGGCGNFTEEQIPKELQMVYQKALEDALSKGYEILNSGGSSLDAVEAAVVSLENCPLFNAGLGAVYTEAITYELDASIMDGKTLKAGAVAGVKHIKNPITAARKVMDKTEHVLLIGDGAEKFAKEQNITMVDESYFRTAQQKEKEFIKLMQNKNGTVGAVAIDKFGNLAAATSTGGMINKKVGRVGDSPIIGAGTYADNQACAVSGTGWGEYFIRNVIAYDINALMKYKNYTIEEAVDEVIHNKLNAQKASGGIIAIDKNGNYYFTSNTSGMFRGMIDNSGKPQTFLFIKTANP